MVKKIIVFICLMVISQVSVASVADSLEAKLKNTEGEERLRILSDLCWEYSFYNFNKAEKYAQEELAYAEKTDSELYRAQAYNDLGIVLYKKANYNKALEYYQKSLEIREKIGNKAQIASSLLKISLIYVEKGDYVNGLNYNLRTLKLYEELNDDVNKSNTINNIANIYVKLKQFDKAIEYSNIAYELCKKYNNYSCMAVALSNLGDSYERIEQVDKSFKYYFEAEKLYIKLNDKLNLAGIYNNLGVNYRYNNDWEKGLEYYKKALSISEELQDYAGYVLYTQNIAGIYVDMGKFDEAEEFFLNALRVAQTRGLKPYMRIIYQSLAVMYIKNNQTEKATEFFDKYRFISDTIFNQQLSKSIAEMQTKYETDKKDQEISLLTKEKEIQSLIIGQQKNQRNILIGGIILMVIVAYLLFSSYQLRQKELLTKEKLKQEQIRLNAQIMAQENERKRIAEELHDGIGQMLSAVKLNIAAIDNTQFDNPSKLNTAMRLIDESCHEIRVISHNMMPSALTKAGLFAAVSDFGERISNSGKLQVYVVVNDILSKRLNPYIEVNLFRIIQELVNNAMKYANATEIHIQFTINDNNLAVMIEDNGIGFDKNIIKTGKGNGWNNITSRANLLNALLEVDTKPGKGTAVFIEVPLDGKAELKISA